MDVIKIVTLATDLFLRTKGKEQQKLRVNVVYQWPYFVLRVGNPSDRTVRIQALWMQVKAGFRTPKFGILDVFEEGDDMKYENKLAHELQSGHSFHAVTHAWLVADAVCQGLVLANVVEEGEYILNDFNLSCRVCAVDGLGDMYRSAWAKIRLRVATFGDEQLTEARTYISKFTLPPAI